jgi:uncharacterized protein YjiS (DUF1127 family)
MPPRQTDPASGSDAAALGLDTILLVEATANASMAPPDDALSERNAAGSAAVRHVSSVLKRYWRAFGEWQRRQRSRTTVHELSDRELMDIGVTRDEIDHIAPHRAIDALRDGTAHFWIRSRGVM